MTRELADGRSLAEPLAAVPGVSVGELRDALRSARRLVVLDDDPTGTQTVHDLPVLTRWEADDLRWALEQDTAGFFILTNTRSLSPESAAERLRDIVSRCLDMSAELDIDLDFASRGDSTLRGHFPLETDVIEDVLRARGMAVDGVLLAPAYIDAGRVTVDGIHLIRRENDYLPVGESEFAQDATFGYRSSDLGEWVEEKSSGRILRADVRHLNLDMIRSDPKQVLATLRQMDGRRVLVLDALADEDLQVAVLQVLRAEAEGMRFVYRVGPSFVRARVGQQAVDPVSDAVLASLTGSVDGDSTTHGLVVVGSHVPTTSRQLIELASRQTYIDLELDVSLISDPHVLAGHLDDIVGRATTSLPHSLVVLRTSRMLSRGVDEAESLQIARQVSVALTSATRRIVSAIRPSFVVAKGGITSSDIATDALDIDRAFIRGSLLPGIVSLWESASGVAQGLPYVVFAGNVGSVGDLAEVIARLEGDIISPSPSRIAKESL